jgi:maleylacetoacetate isomerase
MKLYGYFRSSASYRVRIALNLKGLSYEQASIHLSREGGQQFAPAFRMLNPQALVPVLDDGGRLLTQSLAMIEYLDETHPEPPLLPASPEGRARVRALAQAVACDIHPLNNLRVLNYLSGPLGASDESKRAWYHHWIAEGLRPLEAMLAGAPERGRFCHGGTPGLADCCLVPQLANARRFKCDLAPYQTLLEIESHCLALEAFQRAAPDKQPDAE